MATRNLPEILPFEIRPFVPQPIFSLDPLPSGPSTTLSDGAISSVDRVSESELNVQRTSSPDLNSEKIDSSRKQPGLRFVTGSGSRICAGSSDGRVRLAAIEKSFSTDYASRIETLDEVWVSSGQKPVDKLVFLEGLGKIIVLSGTSFFSCCRGYYQLSLISKFTTTFPTIFSSYQRSCYICC